MRRLAATTSLILATAIPGAATSQAPDSAPAMVPVEFVELLSSTMFSAPTELVVGELPAAVAAIGDAGSVGRVIGGLRSRYLTVGAVVMPGTEESARATWDEKLRAADWTAREREAPAWRGGFEREPAIDSRRTSYCSSDDRMLMVSARAIGSDSTVVLLSTTDAGGTSPCSSPPMHFASGDPGESPMPILRAPEAAVQRFAGTGGGSGDWSSHARLRTERTIGSLLAHYASQMLGQGWQPIAQSVADEVAILVSRKTDDEGQRWQAVLYVALLPAGDRELHLRITGDRR